MANMGLGIRGPSVRIDWITGLLIVTATLIFLFGTVFIKTETSLLASGAITIMIAGLTLGVVFRTYSFDMNLSKKEFAQIMTWTIACMGVVLMMNYATPRFSEIELAGFNPRFFGVLMGVSEETFFRGFLLPWLHRLTKSGILAVLLSASAFAVFHLNVYSGQLSSLIIVLGGGLVLGYATLRTQRLTPATSGHCFINFLAG